MPIKLDKIDKGVIFAGLVICLAAYLMCSGCATGNKGIDTSTQKTTQTTTGDNATIYNMDFNGWSVLAGIFGLLKVWFWRKGHIATKALDRVIRNIDESEKVYRDDRGLDNEPPIASFKTLKEGIWDEGRMGGWKNKSKADSTEHLIRSRIKRLFPKHKEIK